MLPERINALRGVGPVDAPDLDCRIIEQAGREIVLIEAGGAQRTLHLEIVDGETHRVLDLSGGEAGCSSEGRAFEGEVAVVVGEAEPCAVDAGDAPAPGKRSGAGVEVGLESWGKCFHWDGELGIGSGE